MIWLRFDNNVMWLLVRVQSASIPAEQNQLQELCQTLLGCAMFLSAALNLLLLIAATWQLLNCVCTQKMSLSHKWAIAEADIKLLVQLPLIAFGRSLDPYAS